MGVDVVQFFNSPIHLCMLEIISNFPDWVGGWGWGLALTFWAIDDARAVGDDEYKTSNDEG